MNMTDILAAFASEPLFAASAKFLKHLGVKFSTQTEEPIPFLELYEDAATEANATIPKDVKAIFSRVENTYFIGTVTDDTLKGENAGVDFKAEAAKLDRYPGLSAEDKAFFADASTKPFESLSMADRTRMMQLKMSNGTLSVDKFNFGDKPLAQLREEQPERFGFDEAQVEQEARHGGYVTYAGKQCTEFAVADAAVRLVRAVVSNEHYITPCSTLMTGDYGESGFFTSLPCVIGANGVEEVLHFDLSDAELREFQSSCAHVKENLRRIRLL